MCGDFSNGKNIVHTRDTILPSVSCLPLVNKYKMLWKAMSYKLISLNNYFFWFLNHKVMTYPMLDMMLDMM